MSSGQRLRASVKERLSAAAEDICALFESAIADYEEELRRSKHENQRIQRLLDSALSPRVVLVRAGVQVSSLSPGLTPHIKEEHNIKQKEDQLQVSVPEFSSVSVKTEESSLLQQRQTEQREDTPGEDIRAVTHVHREDTQGEDIRAETHVHREDTQGQDISSETHVHREDTQGEDISSETHVHLETEEDTKHSSDIDEDWRAPLSCSPAHTDTGDGDHHNQVQSRARSTTAQNSCLSPKYKCAPETRATVNNGDMSGTGEGADSRKPKCSVCKERFGSKYKLLIHKRVHRGEEPFSCSVCKKLFPLRCQLKRHMKIHTGEKPFSCSVCKKVFAANCQVKRHMRTHTGEKPFSCSVCKKAFADSSAQKTHMRTHTGEKPFSCSVCKKAFADSAAQITHMKIHTGEKPFSCSICKKAFARKSDLKRHEDTHGRNHSAVQSVRNQLQGNIC